MRVGKQNRSDQTSKHFLDEAEEIKDRLAERRRRKLFERLQKDWPHVLDVCYDLRLPVDKRNAAWITMMLDLTPAEKAVFWEDSHKPELKNLFRGFHDHPGGEGEAFQKWIEAGNQPDYEIWHGGYLWRKV